MTMGGVTGLSYDSLSAAEVLAVLARRERLLGAVAATGHVLIGALGADAVPHDVGAASWPDALATTLRISMKEAKRRVASAALLGRGGRDAGCGAGRAGRTRDVQSGRRAAPQPRPA